MKVRLWNFRIGHDKVAIAVGCYRVAANYVVFSLFLISQLKLLLLTSYETFAVIPAPCVGCGVSFKT